MCAPTGPRRRDQSEAYQCPVSSGYPLHEAIRESRILESVAKKCPLIVMAVPSSSFRETASTVGEWVRGAKFLSATKGLESDTFATMTEVLREETCCKKVGALSGPNLAREIMEGHPAATVIASRYEEVIEMSERLVGVVRLRRLWKPGCHRCGTRGSPEEYLAIAAGVASGLGMGDNAKAFLITRGLAEISRLGVAAGADALYFRGIDRSQGLDGNLRQSSSRNHQVGKRLGQGDTLEDILRIW